MCGGRGTRLDSDTEKPLFDVAGRPMVDRVRDALAAADRVDTTHAVVSPHAPETRAHLDGELPLVETPGDGYVADLGVALDAVEPLVLSVAADLPLLAGDAVDDLLTAADGSTSVCVPRALKELLGASVDSDDTWVPTGVNVVGDGDDASDVYRSYDARLAVNVNRRADAAVAERLLDATDTAGVNGDADVEGGNGP
ncbi:NTP transferase domain-containing protein [Halobacterium rubrum]|uniref:NTP transferase domain-containing protein n=1 Tax=Halobacterium TaxID=2239 RepID=UPI001F3FECC9|nr:MULTISPECIES: NTP transferase domain-containing protein [Halobacterium]MDH5019642.1 NTP transferase domain-containing protein [Halobacterium rubrum]